MQTRISQPHQTRTAAVAAEPDAAALTTVGTFAEGQSAHGSYRVTAEAGLGSFAEGVAAGRPSETA